ncbi:MFS transporter [Phycicoccus endophyticus]|uniref:MFS transporter n=2 Tax=Phycicoccus endophyticus TaxID=1690220 RepID=UPI0019B842F5|nr:MFS transporter [Phycicoccus endophyticus]GGL27297.1 MFS transporter [Phycicoccus endophyticus]
MTTTVPAPGRPRERVVTARTAVFVVFALAGVVFASWAARIADTKIALGLSAGELGVTLLAASAGSVTGLPLAGRVVDRVGAARAVLGGMALALTGLLATAVVVDAQGSRYLVMVGLYLVGLGIGVWDVAMNLEGAAVERELGRSVMPHFHAAFSGGTVLSALAGAAASALGIPLTAHFLASAVLTLVLAAWALPRFLPRALVERDDDGQVSAPQAAPSAWLEPRTLLIGVVVLAAAFTEGTANDWLAVAFVEGHELPAWAGVLGFATFLTAMTAGRLVGTALLDRHGRVPVLRVSFALAVLGALGVVFGPAWLAFVGAAVWGVGAALGFPVGMSASADEPERATARMSVVATIGYVAFLAGPPLLGFLGDHAGVLHALLVVGALALLALAVVPAVRHPQDSAPSA